MQSSEIATTQRECCDGWQLRRERYNGYAVMVGDTVEQVEKNKDNTMYDLEMDILK